MRIIAGSYRGKNLLSPKSGEVRPTADRAKEALFNILNSKLENQWENCRFLDVFAGSGAIGLEAMSRGADMVGFVDINTDNLMQNLRLFPKEKSKFFVYKTSTENIVRATQKYNLVFLDAPYAKNMSTPALHQLFEKGWLQDDALIVVETQKDEDLSAPEEFVLVDERIYGLAKFRFFAIKQNF